ncbi:hypothetical protein DFJ73DRAFT_944410 [Zopfochytrium polystomum]|nr:hypothetical protein DFJ73DRAFT_944410 [Zopfochytrium polystomum]
MPPADAEGDRGQARCPNASSTCSSSTTLHPQQITSTSTRNRVGSLKDVEAATGAATNDPPLFVVLADPTRPTLTDMPAEILESIFVYAGNPNFPRACRACNAVTTSPISKARWLLARYGPRPSPGPLLVLEIRSCPAARVAAAAAPPGRWLLVAMCGKTAAAAAAATVDAAAASGCGWFGRRLRRLPDDHSANAIPAGVGAAAPDLSDTPADPAAAAAPQSRLHPYTSATPCALERLQITIAYHVLQLGGRVRAGGNMALRVAAKTGHLSLVLFLLDHGADPHAVVVQRRRSSAAARRRGRKKVGGGVVDEEFVDFEDVDGPRDEPLQRGPLPSHQHANLSSSPLAVQAAIRIVVTIIRVPISAYLWLAERRWRRLQTPLKVSLLLQAVEANHIRLVSLLVRRPADVPPVAEGGDDDRDNDGEDVDEHGDDDDDEDFHDGTVRAEGRRFRPQANAGAGGAALFVSQEALASALALAFNLSLTEMAKVLVDAGAQPSAEMIQSLVSRAAFWRLAFGVRERLTPLLVLAVAHTPSAVFHRISPALLRSAAEIGSVPVLRACLLRGADPNAWDGLPLFASVYNGNLAAASYLVAAGHPETRAVVTDHFGPQQRAFCVGLACIEGFAITMFSLLLAIWVVAGVQAAKGYAQMAGAAAPAAAGGNQTDGATVVATASGGGGSGFAGSADAVAVAELSAMAIPIAVALYAMNRMVPFHEMVAALYVVTKEKKRRDREREAQLRRVDV